MHAHTKIQVRNTDRFDADAAAEDFTRKGNVPRGFFGARPRGFSAEDAATGSSGSSGASSTSTSTCSATEIETKTKLNPSKTKLIIQEIQSSYN